MKHSRSFIFALSWSILCQQVVLVRLHQFSDAFPAGSVPSKLLSILCIHDKCLQVLLAYIFVTKEGPPHHSVAKTVKTFLPKIVVIHSGQVTHHT
uniref:Secreted protein n=1 Tax=Arion vulgaris TaxID=1028688 RepID=A0A0B7AMY5_9EUPU